MYDIELTKRAIKELQKLPTKEGKAIIGRLKQIAVNPYASYSFVKKLTGVEGFRLRSGNYRAIYHVLDDKLIVEVVRVAHRKDVYQ